MAKPLLLLGMYAGFAAVGSFLAAWMYSLKSKTHNYTLTKILVTLSVVLTWAGILSE